MPLFEYQQKGVDWLCETTANRYIAWEPGLGKSATAISYADRLNARWIVVLCPAHARENWRREFETWGQLPRDIKVIKTTSQAFDPEAANVVIVSYDQVSRGSSQVRVKLHKVRFKWDLLILDEAHMLGNDSERTRYCLDPLGGLHTKCKRILPLSGTPATKSASELYPVMRALWPETVKGTSWRQFEDFYCRVNVMKVPVKSAYGPKYKEVRQVVGTKPEKLEALRKLLDNKMSIVKTDDVLKEIPPLRVATYPMVVPDRTSNTKSTNLLRQINARLEKLLTADGDFLSNLSKAELAFATERRAIGLAKAPWVAELVNEELTINPSRKIVIFAFHRDVLNCLAELLDTFGVVRVDGEVGTKDKQKAQDRFQTDPTVRVFLGQIKAASTNLTLTAAADVILAEASWNPGDNYQAIRRCRRIGQTKPVLARYVTMVGADDKISRILAERSQELDTLFANEEDINA